MSAPATTPHRATTPRLHVVTGKGGTGKTTVAAALAIALAHGGRRVLLVEVEGRQGIAQVFDLPPLPYEERRVVAAPGGGEVFALAVDPEAALLEYLEMFYNLRRAGKALRRIGAIDFATTIAPGMRDVLLTGKVKEAVVRVDKRRPGGMAYDHVVLDAPPTGRITRFLSVSSEVSVLARLGPIRSQADGVMAVLRSPQTAVHVVTLLEPMPTQETTDGVAELEAADLPVGSVVVNLVRPPVLEPGEREAALAGGLATKSLLTTAVRAAGLPASALASVGPVLAAEAAEAAERVVMEDQQREALSALDRPLVSLPLLAQSIDLGALYRLAEHLREQGLGSR